MFEIVVNPAGANGGTLKSWKKAEKILQENKEEYRVHFSTLEHGIRDIVAEITDTEEPVWLIIFGGDGTMNQAINGIRDFDRTYVGIVPCGSGNDLALSLGIPNHVEENMNVIMHRHIIRQLDVGEVHYFDKYDEKDRKFMTEEDRWRFNISAGIGFDAEICQQVSVSSSKKALNKVGLGKLSYIYVALGVIFKAEKVAADITCNGITKHYPKLLFTVAMNQPYEGGGFMFAPEASGTDGMLDQCIGDDLSQWDFFRIFPYAYKGNHVKFKGVYLNKTRETEIRTEKPMWVHTDGEVECKSTHIGLRILEKKLKMID